MQKGISEEKILREYNKFKEQQNKLKSSNDERIKKIVQDYQKYRNQSWNQ